MGKRKVAIQGVEGCFHEEAAREYFCSEDIVTIPCETFGEMGEILASNPEITGIMAIENTIAGSLLPNHQIIDRHNLRIIGEHKKRISHVLATLPGEKIEDIFEVDSHPMALMQCEEFLSRHPAMKMIEKFDTAGSAREIAEFQLKGHAAICGRLAADLYGLDILEEGIETNKRNFTRFLIITGTQEPEESHASPDKSSIVFTLPHTQGALSKILTILAFYDLNLTRIQSLPIIGQEWEYKFYVDLTFVDPVRYRQALEAVKPLTNNFRVLGEYCETRNFKET